MDNRAQSAAYLVFFLSLAFLVVGYVFTLINPSWSAILDSPLFTFDTQWGQDLGTWLVAINAWVMLFSLIAILFKAAISSRRAGV